MTRGRRAVVLTALAVLLGGLAAADVARRERALGARLGPTVSVLVARAPVPAGAQLSPAVLGVRRVPARYAPPEAYSAPAEVTGLRARSRLAAGTDLVPALVDDGARKRAVGPPVRPGERVAELVARGSPALVTPGVRVDVLVTRETADGSGSTLLALEDAEVLAAAPAADERSGDNDRGARVAVSLRTTLRQAVYLAAAQDFARDVRVLPRAAGDRRRGATGLRVGSGL